MIDIAEVMNRFNVLSTYIKNRAEMYQDEGLDVTTEELRNAAKEIDYLINDVEAELYKGE